mgnify:CR=1 FL=1
MGANLSQKQIEEKKKLGVRTIVDLYKEFHDNELPDGADFATFINSYHHKNEKNLGIPIDDRGNNVSPEIRDEDDVPRGYMRYNGQEFQVWNEAEAVWESLGGGLPSNDSTDIDFEFPNGTTLLADTGEKVEISGSEVKNLGLLRVGRAALGTLIEDGKKYAVFGFDSFLQKTDNPQLKNGYFLRQDEQGRVIINSPFNQSKIRFTYAGEVDDNTKPHMELTRSGTDANLFVKGNIRASEDITPNFNSDKALKEDIIPFEDGLKELSQIQPVKFRYNGKAGTNPDKENIGIIAQDIEKIFPYMIEKFSSKLNPDDEVETELLGFKGHNSLTFVLINAVKELSEKVKVLQKEIKELKG